MIGCAAAMGKGISPMPTATFLLCLAMAAGAPDGTAELDVAYGPGGDAQKLDLYLPAVNK